MKKWMLFFMISMAVVVFAACNGDGGEESQSGDQADSSSDSITISHEYGEVSVKKNPENVVVFDFGILDTLDELGVEASGIPQATVPEYLDKYSSSDYINVGSLKEPDFEAIHGMEPDVIFISTRQSELYDQFSEIAPTVYLEIDYENYMESFKTNMETLGKIFGKEEQIQAELEDIDSRVAAAREKTAGLDQKALIVLANEGKVSAYGPSSRYGLIHDVFGFKPADENIEVSQHGQGISFEYILENNPDILFVIDRNAALDSGAEPAKATIENDLVKKTSAYKEGKIIYLDADYWYLSGGGLQSMKAMITSLENAY
ncbi:siderophore ABC transporter substrate-binding protein [Siminovitchia sediminis]|uniref:Siderophore ABC transporter substrate-binding protein n=1 Tax=Siminovitchia sediminis TaxID=1274353 RepID=A0ABW4KDA2_9BACI